MQEATPAPPDTIHTHDELEPRAPFSFLREAAGGGFAREGWHLMVAWVAFVALTSAAWAAHLRRLAGWSALPAHWGERLTARDLWELMENGGLKHDLLGPFTFGFAALALVWALWSGWRMQTRAVGLAPRLGPWFWGFVDALVVGLVPLLIPTALGLGLLGKMADSGIQGLGWLHLVLGNVLRAAAVSAFMLQWWFCRLDRAAGPLREGRPYLTHLGHSFLRLWMHPIQWFLLLAGGAALRLGLGFGALALAWRWGGGSPARVWAFLLVQAAAAAGSGWLIGWLLRLSALFWKQDREVRRVRAALVSAVSHPLSEPPVES